MLFSNKIVAKFLNDNFEIAKHSVADVPKVQIDFGNGNVIRRSFRGDVATYVCDSSGVVLDVLPGIYDSQTYVDSLAQILNETRFDVEQAPAFLSRYHEARLRSVETAELAGVSPAEFKSAVKKFDGKLNSPLDFEEHGLLALDAQNNEAAARPVVHQYLASRGAVRPQEIQDWLYKELFHIDLTDPFLGIKAELERNYPFEQ